MRTIQASPSSRALAKIVLSRGLFGVAEDTGIHYTQIWRYATGRCRPTAVLSAKLHRATRGRVSSLGWSE